MQITRIETIEFSGAITVHAGGVNWLWVGLHTDEGLVGLGETYPEADTVESVLKNSLAKVLLGRDPLVAVDLDPSILLRPDMSTQSIDVKSLK